MGTAVNQKIKDTLGKVVNDGLAVPSSNELLSIEDAARLSGRSQPFIMALLDSPSLYKGTVIRAPEGSCRMVRDEFMAWLSNAPLPEDLPKAIVGVRSGPRDCEPVEAEESKEQKKERNAAKAKSLEAARSLGLL